MNTKVPRSDSTIRAETKTFRWTKILELFRRASMKFDKMKILNRNRVSTKFRIRTIFNKNKTRIRREIPSTSFQRRRNKNDADFGPTVKPANFVNSFIQLNLARKNISIFRSSDFIVRFSSSDIFRIAFTETNVCSFILIVDFLRLVLVRTAHFFTLFRIAEIKRVEIFESIVQRFYFDFHFETDPREGFRFLSRFSAM